MTKEVHQIKRAELLAEGETIVDGDRRFQITKIDLTRSDYVLLYVDRGRWHGRITFALNDRVKVVA